jgi:hypothetical protein
VGHQMTLTNRYDSGEELWTCGQCDRVLSIRWSPFRREVIVRGDEVVPHHGSKGGLTMAATVAND